jgi:predicted metal-dependent HD superfamily phosphohydrolase
MDTALTLPPVLIARLEAAYREPQRHYHTLDHIAALQRGLAAHRHLAERPDLIDAAIWFHDAIYDPQRSDNEERSAQWAEAALAALAWPEAAWRAVAAMVRATAHHEGQDASADTRLFLDLDLSVLGQTPATYDAYAAAVRAEYAWVEPHTYATRRAALLRAFLARPLLYDTPELRSAWEDRARRNLAREIEALERPGTSNHEEESRA